MKPEEIIELAKKAARETDPDYTDFDPPEKAVAGLMRFAALHREALIASGELVPREQVEADKRDAERYHKVMHLLRDAKMDHGLCQPRERRACTRCNALDDIEKIISEYKGMGLTIQSDRARSQP